MKLKNTLLLTLIYLLLYNQSSAQAPPEILHYNFNGTGTVIPNMASSPPLGTANASIVGTQSLGSTGQCGGALVGDGTTSSYVNTAWTTSLSGSWTISFWTASITPSSTLWYIFGDAGAGSFRCFTNGVAGANNWMLRGPITDILITGGATMAPQLNTFVYNSVTGVTTSYLNGVFNASVTQAPVTISGTGPFKVGQYGSNSGLPSGGLMDEFRVYSRALTVTEIQQLSTFVPTATNITATSCGTYTSSANNTYSVSGTYTENVVTCGGSATNTLNLTINPAPTLTVTASSSVICNGETTDLLTSGTATSFTWDTGANTSSTTVAPTTNTSYVVTGSLSSCSITKTVSVNVNPTPVVNLVASTPSVCLGNSVTLNATGAPIYSWSPVTASSASVIDYPSATTVYTVTGTNTFNCSDSKTVSVIVNSYTPGISNSATICAGDGITLNATGGTNYSWSNGSPFASITVTPALTTTYSVSALGSVNGCAGSNSVTVNVNPNPTITVSAARTQMCKFESNTLTASGASTYSWSNSSSTASSVVINPTVNIVYTYTVTGIDANGCDDTKFVSVTVNACTGLTEELNDNQQVFVSPNPNNGVMKLHLSSAHPNTILKVYNVTGTLVKEQKAPTETSVLDLQQEPNGIYFIYVEQNTETVKILKIIKH